MIEWILYSLVVGILIALACRGLEEAWALVRAPVRWLWAAGLLTILGLMGTAAFRVQALSSPGAQEPVGPGDVGAVLESAAVEAGSMAIPLSPGVASAVTAVPLARASAALRGVSGSRWERVFGGIWIGLSALVLLVWVWTAFLYGCLRRRAPVVRLQGTAVRLTPCTGPAVVGLLRPEIVVPQWLSRRSEEEQRLILAHELEHLRARDPLLLLLAWLGTALVPWHPAMWWIASRLRLATEIDCDARVLRGGAEPLGYGTLLIASAGRSPGVRLGTAPLGACSPSQLERRLMAMTPIRRRFAFARGGLVAVGAAAAVLVACEASLPTAAEIEAMDLAAVEQVAAHLGTDGELAGAQYLVDGVEVSAEEARAIPADRIASIQVAAADSGAPFRYEVAVLARPRNGELEIVEGTRAVGYRHRNGELEIIEGTTAIGYGTLARPRDGSGQLPTGEGVVIMMDRVGEAGAGETILRGPDRLTADSVRVQTRGNILLAVPGRSTSSPRQTSELPPLIFIDGVRSDAAAVAALGRTNKLKNIEIVRAAEAVRRYGPAAAGGALVINTQ